jgi:hypothetical protein
MKPSHLISTGLLVVGLVSWAIGLPITALITCVVVSIIVTTVGDFLDE